MHPEVQHPVLVRRILNSPNSGSGDSIVELPNGVVVNLILLGEKISITDTSSEKWWPTAESPKVRSKLFRRIIADGLLPMVTAITLALVSGIYTTTAVPKSEEPRWQCSGRTQVRLTYNYSPIVDIGIAKGTCRVTPQDRMAFYDVEEDEFLMGQDPKDHYWIYFTTLNGHEYFLDCGMFTFDFTVQVDVTRCVKYGLPPIDWAPAFFYGKDLDHRLARTEAVGWQAKERFSILRNSDLWDVLRSNGDYSDKIPNIHSLLDKIAGRTCSDWERQITVKFLESASKIFYLNTKNRDYVNFPKEPQISLELDPNERVRNESAEEDRESEALDMYLVKWTRRLRKGKVNPQRWNAAFNAWQDKPHSMRMKMAGMAPK